MSTKKKTTHKEPSAFESKVAQKPRVKKYFATYIGAQKDIRLSGVGRITPGKEFEVSEKVAHALELADDWKVRFKYEYIDL